MLKNQHSNDKDFNLNSVFLLLIIEFEKLFDFITILIMIFASLATLIVILTSLS